MYYMERLTDGIGWCRVSHIIFTWQGRNDAILRLGIVR
jgi:hypothetical protein